MEFFYRKIYKLLRKVLQCLLDHSMHVPVGDKHGREAGKGGEKGSFPKFEKEEERSYENVVS